METTLERMSAVFAWLINSTLQVSILVCLVLMIKGLLGDKLSPRWHYCLWLFVLVRIFLPWAPQSRISVFNLVPDLGKRSIQTQSYIFDTNPGTSATSEEIILSQGSAASSRAALEAVSLQEATLSVKEAVPDKKSGWFGLAPKLLLTLVWLMGAFVLALFIFVDNLKMWMIVRRERSVTDKNILDLFEECKKRMKVRTVVGVVVTDMIKSPALFGFIRPRLLLPAKMINSFNRAQLRYVFMHELAHLRRHDIGISWLAAFGLVLHWFNPLVWFAFYCMRIDRELACDGLALSMMNVNESDGYGRTIVDLLERFSQSRRLVSMAGVMDDKRQLKRRITMIAQFDKGKYRHSFTSMVLIIMLGCVVLTNGMSKERLPRPFEELVPARLHRNLVLYYAFDSDNGGDVLNIAGKKYDGKVRGAEYIQEGLIGGAMEFDGKSDYVSAGNVELREFSFCGWMKTNEGDLNNRRILLIDNGRDYFSIQGNGNGGVGVCITDDIKINENDFELEAGRWTHLAVTYDGDTIKIYINGKLTETGEAVYNREIRGRAYIGFSGKVPSDNRHDGSFCFNGMMDEVGIYNRALPHRDIKAIYDLTASASILDYKQKVRGKTGLQWWKDSADSFDRTNDLYIKKDWQQMKGSLAELAQIMDKYNAALDSEGLYDEEEIQGIKSSIDKCQYSRAEYNSLVKLTDEMKNICNDLRDCIAENKEYALKNTYGLLYRKWSDFERIIKAESDVKYKTGWTISSGGSAGGSSGYRTGTSSGKSGTRVKEKTVEWNNELLNIDLQRKIQFIEMYGDEDAGGFAAGGARAGAMGLTSDDIGKFKTRAQMCMRRIENLNYSVENMKKDSLISNIRFIKQGLEMFGSALMLDEIKEKLEESNEAITYEQIKNFKNLEMLKNTMEGYAEDKHHLQQIKELVSGMAAMAEQMRVAAVEDDRKQLKRINEKLYNDIKKFADIFNLNKTMLREYREEMRKKRQEEFRRRIESIKKSQGFEIPKR